MGETYHAYLGRNPTPVRTFNALDLAEAFRDRMAALGSDVRLQRIPEATTEEIEHELARQQMEDLP